MASKKIAAAKFKETCLQILDNVDPEGLVITKHGRPVARLLPVSAAPESLIGSMKDSIECLGDVFSTGTKWNAES